MVITIPRQQEPVIVAGDLNIAHTEDDIWNPSGNKKTSGFLPRKESGSQNYCQMAGLTHSENS